MTLRPKIGWMEKNLSLQESIFLAAGFVLLIWSVKLVESMLGENLYYLGVNPQAVSGLFGVLVAPLIHGATNTPNSPLTACGFTPR